MIDLVIERLYAYIATDPADNSEGVFSAQRGGLVMPLVGADEERMLSLRSFAVDAAKLGARVELVVFERRRHIEWINDDKI